MECERVLGPDHRHTLQLLTNLAIAYRKAGRTADAIALHEKTLAACERVLGPDDPETRRAEYFLAEARAAGRTADAIASRSPHGQ